MANETVTVTQSTNSVSATQSTDSVTVVSEGPIGLNAGGTIEGALNVGVDGTGHDVKFFGDTAGKYMQWDQSADKLFINGEFEVNGTATTFNSTVITIDDPIFSLGGQQRTDALDDSKDRGLEFFYHDGAQKTGFMGYDDSADSFTFLTSATNSNEVFSGTAATVQMGNLNFVEGSGGQIQFNGTEKINIGTNNIGLRKPLYGMTGTVDIGLSSNPFRDGHFSGTVNAGEITLSTATPTLAIQSGTNEAEGSKIRLTEGATFNGAFIHYDGSANALNIGVHDPFNTTLSDDTNVITIPRDTGNLGLGVAAPATKVHILNGTTNDPHIRLSDPNSTSTNDATGYLEVYHGNTTSRAGYFGMITNAEMAMATTTSSGKLCLYTGTGVKAVTIDNSQRVGIGVSAPSNKLHIKDATNPPEIRLEDAAGGTQTGKIIFDQAGQNSLVLSTQYQSSSDGNVIQFAPADSVAMTIRGGTGSNNGNVGIGTTSPSQKLHVDSGHVLLSNNYDYRGIDTAGNQRTLLRINSSNEAEYGSSLAGPIKFMGGGSYTERMRIHTDGNIGIGTTAPSNKLHINDDESTGTGILVTGGGAGGPLATFTRDVGPHTGTVAVSSSSGFPQIQFATNNTFAIGVNNTNFEIADNTHLGTNARFTIDSSGKVGIGTTAPLGKLHVHTADAGSFTYDTTADDFIVESNASGGMTIATAAANTGRIIFASPDDPTGAEISFSQTGLLMKVGPTTPNADLVLQAANSTEFLRLDASDDQTVASKDIRFQDSIKARFGSSSDLQIQHSSDHSYVENTKGHLYLNNHEAAKHIYLRNHDGGGVATYLTLSGSLGFTLANKAIRFPDSVIAGFGDSSDFQIKHTGDTYLSNLSGAMYLRQQVTDGDMIFQCDDGSGGDETYFFLDGSTGYTQFPDDKRLTLGSSNDFQLVHFAGSNTYLVNNSGDLVVQNTTDDKDIIFQCDDGSGGVETYFFLDGSTGYTQFPDGKRLVLGSGNDLHMRHDGSDTQFTNTTGDFILTNSANDKDLILKSDDGSGGVAEYMRLDGSAESVVFSKTVQITGNLQVDGTTQTINSTVVTIDDPILTLGGDTAPSSDDNKDRGIEFRYYDGSAKVGFMGWDDSASGFTLLKDATNSSEVFSGTAASLVVGSLVSNGNLAVDTDTLYVDASNNRVGIKTSSPSSSLHVNGSATIAGDIEVPSSARLRWGNGDAQIIEGKNSNYSLTFSTYDGSSMSDKMIILGDGNIGIGTMSPARKFHVNSGADNEAARIESTDTEVALELKDSTGTATIKSRGDFRFNGSSGEICRMESGGNVGIGTTAPSFTSGGGLQITHSSQANVRLSDSSDASYNTDVAMSNADFYLVNRSSTGNLKFRVNNSTEAITVIPSGKVGIGTASPEQRLHVDGGNVKFSRAGDHQRLILTSGTSDQAIVYFGDSDNNYQGRVGYLNASDALYFNSNGAERMRLDSSGNVGIGTTAPESTLQVKSGSSSHSAIIGRYGNDDGLFLHSEAGSSHYNWMITTQDNVDKGFEIIPSTAVGNQTFSTPAFVIKADTGNVGIGTTAPSYKLDVDGDIRVLDGHFIYAGDSTDLQIRHDGSNSKITNTTGDLYLINGADDKDIIFQSDNGSGGLETYFFLDGSISRNVFTKDAQAYDNVRLLIGDGSDLRVSHDGSDSLIDNYTGNLHIRNYADDGDITFRSDDGSGGDTQYFRLDGGQAGSGNVFTIFPDNSYIGLGSNGAGDFIMAHNGTNTTLANYTGNLQISNNADDGDLIFQCDDGSGGVADYFKLDGGLGYNVASKHVRFEDNIEARFGAGSDLRIYHDGNNNFVDGYNGHVYIRNTVDDHDIVFQTDDGSGGLTAYLTIDGSAEITKFFKGTKHLDSVVGAYGDSSDLLISHTGSLSRIQNSTGHFEIINSADDKDIIFKSDDGSGGHTAYLTIDGGAEETVAAKHIRFNDDVQARFGSGADANILHNDTDWYIQNSKGHLYINNYADDKDIIFKTDDGSGGQTEYLRLDGSTETVAFSKAITQGTTLVNDADHTTTRNDTVILFHSMSTYRYLTISSADCIAGRMIHVKNRDNAQYIYINTEGSETIDGASSDRIDTTRGAMTLVSDGSNWSIISKYTG